MTEDADTARAWDIVEKISTCMLTTVDGGVLRARPMHAYPSREEDSIWFVTDARTHKDEEIAADPRVCLAFASPDDNVFVSVTGEAEVLHDPAKARDLWSGFADAWFPEGPEDPNVRILRFTPQAAEFWNGPSSSIVIAFELAQARAGGETPDIGENRKVSFG